MQMQYEKCGEMLPETDPIAIQEQQLLAFDDDFELDLLRNYHHYEAEYFQSKVRVFFRTHRKQRQDKKKNIEDPSLNKENFQSQENMDIEQHQNLNFISESVSLEWSTNFSQQNDWKRKQTAKKRERNKLLDTLNDVDKPQCTPAEYFNTLFNKQNSLYLVISQQTNQNALSQLDNIVNVLRSDEVRDYTKLDYYLSWVPTTQVDIKLLLFSFVLMDLIRLPSLAHYFSSDKYFVQTLINMMPKTQFFLILEFLSLSFISTSKIEDLSKMQQIISGYSACSYVPGKEIILYLLSSKEQEGGLAESRIADRFFQSYVRKQNYRESMAYMGSQQDKLNQLQKQQQQSTQYKDDTLLDLILMVDSHTGYVFQTVVLNKEMPLLDINDKIVNEGYIVYAGKELTNIDLARKLNQLNIKFTGMLTLNVMDFQQRSDLPCLTRNHFGSERIDYFLQQEQLLLSVFYDKDNRNTVKEQYLSTIHTPNEIQSEWKINYCSEFREYYSNCQMEQYWLSESNRIFFQMLFVIMVNSYIVYLLDDQKRQVDKVLRSNEMSSSIHQMSFVEFKQQCLYEVGQEVHRQRNAKLDLTQTEIQNQFKIPKMYYQRKIRFRALASNQKQNIFGFNAMQTQISVEPEIDQSGGVEHALMEFTQQKKAQCVLCRNTCSQYCGACEIQLCRNPCFEKFHELLQEKNMQKNVLSLGL